MVLTRPGGIVSYPCLKYISADLKDRPLFTTHNGRWRMAQVLMISIFGQFSGNGLGYFNTVIYVSLSTHMTKSTDQ